MGQPFGVNHDLLVALQARTLGADDIAIPVFTLGHALVDIVVPFGPDAQVGRATGKRHPVNGRDLFDFGSWRCSTSSPTQAASLYNSGCCNQRKFISEISNMSELHGTLVFHATTQALANCLEDFSEETAAETVLALIKSAGVTVSEEDFPLLFDIDDGVLFAEGINCEDQYVIIAPFGEEWLEVLKTLSRSKSLSFWARLQHEHGIDFYIAVFGEHEMIVAIDHEDGELDDDQLNEIEAKWRTAVPNDIRGYFPEDFE